MIDLIFAKTSPTTAEQVQNTLVEYAKEGHIGILDIAQEGFEFVVVEGYHLIFITHFITHYHCLMLCHLKSFSNMA